MSWWMWLILVLVIIGMFGNASEASKKKTEQEEAKRRQKEAEDYILNSGDQEAIKQLMLARANPANYSQVMAGSANRGNDTLKTAAGVMAGVAAGNLVANAITASAVSSALEKAQTDIASSAIDTASSSFDFDDIG